jgi:hypothetical protein
VKDKSKLTKKEKALLQRKLLQGGAFPHFGERVRFNDEERLILDSAKSKVEKKRRGKKE